MLKEVLCCDWGTSSFRLRLVRTNDLMVLASIDEGQGIASTFNAWQSSGKERFGFYADVLRRSILELASKTGRSLDQIPVILSGMASSTIGMHEVPYADLPFSINGADASAEQFPNFNGENGHLLIISGLKSADDVMRGEETQLVGLFHLDETSHINDNESVIILPGTHSKHIVVKSQAINEFRTFMTGELFNVIAQHTILKDSIAPGGNNEDWKQAFLRGVEISAKGSLLNALFSTRTNQLFGKFSKEQNAAYLSGLVIGSELSELKVHAHSPIYICCGKQLEPYYKAAATEILKDQEVLFIEYSLIDKATIAGQLRIFMSKN